ncbi:unnamed protein product [Diatraea saccharalis]|uniref:Uncharacterized protein n=1 Tax=Diatraea saccharalis TaxID=40085 RepID=A0A9N9RFT4_9NEOP|nr:unnamed protein product [Diatraea saccharalis]
MFYFILFFGITMPKLAKKTFLNSECREFAARLRDYFERENQNGGQFLPLSQVCDRVADALGIGRATVVRINKEKYGEGSSDAPEVDVDKKLSIPNKKEKIFTGLGSTRSTRLL